MVIDGRLFMKSLKKTLCCINCLGVVFASQAFLCCAQNKSGGNKPQSKKIKTHAENKAQLLVSSQGGLKALPQSLRMLEGAQIYHFVTGGQKGLQCGPRAVANALAIRDLVLCSGVLSAANQRERAAKYTFAGKKVENIEWIKVGRLMRKENLKNAFILLKNPYTKPGSKESPYILYSALFETCLRIDECACLMQESAEITGHVICRTGEHWVAVSIIKQQGQKPIMIYMDSCNSSLSDTCVATEFIKFLYHQILGL